MTTLSLWSCPAPATLSSDFDPPPDMQPVFDDDVWQYNTWKSKPTWSFSLLKIELIKFFRDKHPNFETNLFRRLY